MNWSEMMARTLGRGAAPRPDDIVQVAYGYGLFTGGLGAHQGADEAGRDGHSHVQRQHGQRQIMMMQRAWARPCCAARPPTRSISRETIREMGIPTSDLKLRAGCFGAEPWTEAMRKRHGRRCSASTRWIFMA